MSTQRKRPAGNPARQPGLKIEARHKHGARLPEVRQGEHLFTVVGVWRVTDPAAPTLDLDIENLMTIQGPGCFICEQPYEPGLEHLPCPGEPRDQ